MKRSLITRTVLAHLLIKAACENMGLDYVETSSRAKTTFSFPDQTFCPALDVLRFAGTQARNARATNAIAKEVRVLEIKTGGAR